MEKLKQLRTLDDIKLLVDSFYTKVRKDEMLAPIFDAVIQQKWPEHLEKMYRFWQTVLLNEHTYHGTPFLPHANLPISRSHFERWLALFDETIDENFSGEIAQEAKWRAGKMAQMFQHKIDYYRNHSSQPLL